MDLLPILEDLGLQNMKEGEKEISASCPMHPQRLGREDRHASWSINRNTGAHHCFSCGWKGNLNTLFADMGIDMPSDIQTELQLASLSSAKHKFHKTSITSQTPVMPRGLTDEVWKLGELSPVPAALREMRHLTADALADYGVGWDGERKCWVLPIRMPDGELLGAQYKQSGAMFNQPKDVPKSTTLFGIDIQKTSNTVAVVESPLDAVRLHALNIPSVACFGSHLSDAQIRMLDNYFVVVVMALDWDKAGREGTEAFNQRRRQIAPSLASLTFNSKGLPGTDPGDVESDELLKEAWKRTWDINR